MHHAQKTSPPPALSVRMLRALRTVARVLARLLAAIVAPNAVAVALVLAGFGVLVAGVYVLAGLGWALLAAGIACLSVAKLMLRGVANVA